MDVIVIGGGVVGLTTAYELSGRGLRVTVIEAGTPGREASWAGAGILPPARPGDPQHPLAELCRATHPLWPALSHDLLEETGVENGFVSCGGINFSPQGDEASFEVEIEAWQQAGVQVERLTAKELLSWEPSIDANAGPAFRLAETWQVRNPWHLKGLLAACRARGVELFDSQPVKDIVIREGQVAKVCTPAGDYQADAYLIAAGAWSQQLLEPFGLQRTIEPVRGQMLLLSTPRPPVTHLLECGPRYVVPRQDGRTLVGSTEEWVGYEKGNTPSAIKSLRQFAIRLIPELADATIEQTWSGLRPHAVDGLPLLGQISDVENLYVAAGHFRAGLHLSPITARLMTQLICGEKTDISLNPFSC